MSAGSEKEPWYREGLQFSCTQCGNCCSGPSGVVLFSDDEAIQMADKLGITVDDFYDRFTEKVGESWSLLELPTEDGGYDCIFLERDPSTHQGRCSLYEARPGQCRTWPFWPDNLKSRSAWGWAKQNTPCPGMGRGTHHTREEIEAAAAATPEYPDDE